MRAAEDVAAARSRGIKSRRGRGTRWPDRAVTLGREAWGVLVIAEDLGKSGAHSEHRERFRGRPRRFPGHVGLVLGTEMSRLTRSGRNGYRPLELSGSASYFDIGETRALPWKRRHVPQPLPAAR